MEFIQVHSSRLLRDGLGLKAVARSSVLAYRTYKAKMQLIAPYLCIKVIML